MAAGLPFRQFLNNHGIKLFFSSDETIVPGAVIGKRNQGFFSLGTVRQVLGGSASKWSTQLVEANLVSGTVTRNLSLAGKASLSEFGVQIGGGLQHAKTVTFTIQGVLARRFRSQSKLTVAPALNGLRDSNKAVWKEIKGKWVADLTYYASEFTMDFDSETGFNIKADVADQVKVSGDAGFNWKSTKRLSITGNNKVPFGFSGWKI